MVVPEDVQQQLLSRLKRIEGQARGVQRMVEEHRECGEIIRQLASMRAATHSASLFLLKHYARECSHNQAESAAGEQPLEDLIQLLLSSS